MAASNGLVGDDYPTELPQAQPSEDFVAEEVKRARYSKTKEFKQFKEKMEAKIEYRQKFLPGGVPPENVTEEERGKYWAVASIVISDFREILGEYELAKEAVDNK